MSVTNDVRLGSGQMFDNIAHRYDRLNRLMSLGMDKGWRRRLVRALAGSERVIDVATGTADVAIALCKADPAVSVLGVDPSVQMLAAGEEKISAFGGRIELVEGICESLPAETDSADAACISFGIRNVPDRDAGLRDMARVVRPGGTVAILELGEPRVGPLAGLARWHVKNVVPRLGAWLSGSEEYAYLQRSVQAFPAPEDFCQQMTAAGLVDVRVERLSFDAVHLYLGTVPGV